MAIIKEIYVFPLDASKNKSHAEGSDQVSQILKARFVQKKKKQSTF